MSTRRQWLQCRWVVMQRWAQVSEGQRWHAGVSVHLPFLPKELSLNLPCSSICQAGSGAGLELGVWVWLSLVWVLPGKLFLSSHPLCYVFLPFPNQASIVAATLVIWCSQGLEEHSQESRLSPTGLRAALGHLGMGERVGEQSRAGLARGRGHESLVGLIRPR